MKRKGKPPAKPFKKGHDPRRNPGGRPKEEREVVLALREKGDLFVRKLLELIEDGNVRALELAMDRAYGKSQDRVTLAGDESAPINITTVRDTLLARLLAARKSRGDSGSAVEPVGG